MSAVATSSTGVTPTPTAFIPGPINYLPPDAPVQWSSDGHGTYSDHARSCWTAYTDWRRSSADFEASASAANITVRVARVNTTRTFLIPTSTTIYPTTSVSTYSLCDGSVRADISPSTSHYLKTNVELRPSLSTISPSIAPSRCMPNDDDCAFYFFRSNLGHYNTTSNITQWLDVQCGLPVDFPKPCIIQGGPAQLLYFPVSESNREICPTTSAALLQQLPQNAAANNAPPITTLGRTFSAGSAYISFETLYAGFRSHDVPGGEAVQIGPTFSNAVFEFRSDEISTNCFATIDPVATTTAGYGLGTQLNFADLNLPVAASAYKCQNQCRSCTPFVRSTVCSAINVCTTIWDNFNPLLAVPTRLREIVPEWSTCSFWDDRIANIIFDPPIALQVADAPAQATLPSWLMTAMSARPASVSATPTPTALQETLDTVQSLSLIGSQRLPIQPTTAVSSIPSATSTTTYSSNRRTGASENPTSSLTTPNTTSPFNNAAIGSSSKLREIGWTYAYVAVLFFGTLLGSLLEQYDA